MSLDVMDAARNLAEDYRGGAVALAARIDKNPNTFAHELGEQATAKLGLRTAVKMSKRSGDLRILNAFAAELGCMVLQLPEALMVEGNDAARDLGAMAKEFAEVVAEVMQSQSDGRVTENELAAIRRQWAELLAAGQKTLHTLAQQHEAGKPAHLRAVPAGDEGRAA